jgi:hypothetical protein
VTNWSAVHTATGGGSPVRSHSRPGRRSIPCRAACVGGDFDVPGRVCAMAPSRTARLSAARRVVRRAASPRQTVLALGIRGPGDVGAVLTGGGQPFVPGPAGSGLRRVATPAGAFRTAEQVRGGALEVPTAVPAFGEAGTRAFRPAAGVVAAARPGIQGERCPGRRASPRRATEPASAPSALRPIRMMAASL